MLRWSYEENSAEREVTPSRATWQCAKPAQLVKDLIRQG
jgi:hypothetical protein